MSSRTIASFADELHGFETSRGTVRFTSDKQLPLALVRRLVKARIAENEAHAPPKKVERKTAPAARSGKADRSRLDPAVDMMLAQRTHPMMPVVHSLRSIVLRSDPAVREELKWNSPSFRTDEHFATINLGRKGELRLILHAGAKKQRALRRRIVDDPDSILEWLGVDRAMMAVESDGDLKRKSSPLLKVLRAWIAKP